MANQWLLTVGNQYYMTCCPCLVGLDMCQHVGGSGALGCLGSCLFPCCFQCYMAPKIAAMSGIEETTGSAILKTVCCFTCYSSTVVLEYMKQRKLKASAKDGQGQGAWMVTIKDQYYAVCCPCLLGKDMFEHVGKSGALGCLMRCFLPPCFFCCAGPKIAEQGDIPDSCLSATVHMCIPCLEPCYASAVYAEYKYQKQLGIGSPKQQDMQ